VTARRRSVVTIGNFDGVHLGHVALLDRTTGIAADRAADAVAVTFDPHPAALLRPDAVPLALQSIEERVDLLRAHGVDDVVVLTFDERLAAQSPAEFVTEHLVERLRADVVVVGENFRFGAGAAGGIDTLTDLGLELGFTVDPVGLVDVDGRPVSSSAVRALLMSGDLAAASRMLGRSFTITGEVVAGERRGRTIGVPTANVSVPPGRVLPADGVYACWVRPGEGGDGSTGTGRAASERVPAVVNVGWRPTFDGTTRTLEAHLLLDPAVAAGWLAGRREAGGPDLYGRRLVVAFEGRIRGEERFDGPEALVARIRQDVEVARELLDPS
jgi:riboflavin kinase / FMN adenylyltransferase